MKKLIAVLLAVVLLGTLTACYVAPDNNDTQGSGTTTTTKPQENPPTLSIAAIQGPTGVGLVNLMAAKDNGTAKLDYDFVVCSSPEEVVGKVVNPSGEVLLASVPTNVAATLYNKTNGGIRILAINTGCVLNILENGNTINSVADLRGKTIYTTGQGANPEYVLRYLLTNNGLDPDKDVEIKFLTENTELSAYLINGTATVALVPQPVATVVMTKNQNLRVALDVGAEWQAITNESQPLMGCLIAKADFIEKYPETIATFLNEYKASIEAATADVATTAGYCETYGIIEKAAIAQKAIPNCKLQFTNGAAMHAALQGYYEMLYTANPKAVGNAVPKDDFYYVP